MNVDVLMQCCRALATSAYFDVTLFSRGDGALPPTQCAVSRLELHYLSFFISRDREVCVVALANHPAGSHV